MVRRLIDGATLLLIALLALGWWRERGQTAPSSPAPAPFDWSEVSTRDLNIASVFLTAREHGVRQAMDSLRDLAMKDTTLHADGHMIAHALGRFAIANNGHDPAVLAQCRPTFEAGCFHGVLEGYLMSLGQVDAGVVTRLCASYDKPDSTRVTAIECAHGLGHGLLEHFAYDLARALGGCDTFASDDLRGECHDGVFMENAIHGLGMHGMNVGDSAVAMQMGNTMHMQPGAAQATHFRASDLAFPCDSVAASYQPSCWSYQPLVIVNLVRGDFAKTLRTCHAAPTLSRARCFTGFGKQSMAWFGWDGSRVIKTCSEAADHAADCLAGAVEALLDRDELVGGADRFCDAAPASLRQSCREAAARRASSLRLLGQGPR